MRKTRYRIILHDKVEVNPNYMERIDDSTVVSYISDLEYSRQSAQGATGLFFTCPYTGAVGPIDSLWFKDGFLKSKANIIDEIERQIDKFICSAYRGPSVIILHPSTFKELEETIVFEKGSFLSPDHGFYKGVDIRKSFDVEEGKVELY